MRVVRGGRCLVLSGIAILLSLAATPVQAQDASGWSKNGYDGFTKANRPYSDGCPPRDDKGGKPPYTDDTRWKIAQWLEKSPGSDDGLIHEQIITLWCQDKALPSYTVDVRCYSGGVPPKFTGPTLPTPNSPTWAFPTPST